MCLEQLSRTRVNFCGPKSGGEEQALRISVRNFLDAHGFRRFFEISEGIKELLITPRLNQLLYGQNHYFVIPSSLTGNNCVS